MSASWFSDIIFSLCVVFILSSLLIYFCRCFFFVMCVCVCAPVFIVFLPDVVDFNNSYTRLISIFTLIRSPISLPLSPATISIIIFFSVSVRFLLTHTQIRCDSNSLLFPLQKQKVQLRYICISMCLSLQLNLKSWL